MAQVHNDNPDKTRLPTKMAIGIGLASLMVGATLVGIGATVNEFRMTTIRTALQTGRQV